MFVACLAVALAQPQLPTPGEIMQKVGKAYLALSSYSDSATITESPGGARTAVSQATTLYQRPGKFLIRKTGPYGERDTGEYCAWTEGDKVRTWSRILPRPGAYPANAGARTIYSTEQGEYAEASTALTFHGFLDLYRRGMPIQLLILQGGWALDGSWDKATPPYAVSKVTVDGHDCFRISRNIDKQSSSRLEAIDVDARSYLVRQVSSGDWTDRQILFRPVANPPVPATAFVFQVPATVLPAPSKAPQARTGTAAPFADALPSKPSEEIRRILDRCKNAYDVCQTYADTGEVTEIGFPSPGMHVQNPAIRSERFRTRFVRDKGLLVDSELMPPDPEITSLQRPGAQVQRKVGWWVDGWSRNWWQSTDESPRSSSRTLATHAYEAPEPLTFDQSTITRLSMAGGRIDAEPLAFGRDATLRAEEVVDGRPCYVIGQERTVEQTRTLLQSGSYQAGMIVWIDKQTFLIRRLKAFGDRYRGLVKLNPQVNQPIPITDLLFTPPHLTLAS